MPRPAFRALAAVAVLTAASSAGAQEAPPSPTAAAPKAPELAEIEGGFSMGTEVGGLWFFDLPGKGTDTASGAVLGINLGVDAGPLRVGLVAWGQSMGAEPDFRGIEGKDDPHRARGDFQTTLVGLDVHVGIPLWADAQGIPRTVLSLRALGGPTLNQPVGVLEERGIMLAAGPGLEYHTRVRHFAIGLQALGVAHLQDGETAIGLAILPGLRYTF